MSDRQEFIISSHTLTRSFRAKFASSLVLGTTLLLGGVAGVSQMGNKHLRSISGKVEDHGKEPLRGAVVQIEAEDTMAIESYVANEHGEYHFRNLRSDADYQVWASFRGHHSKKQEISKFDREADRVIDLSIDMDKD